MTSKNLEIPSKAANIVKVEAFVETIKHEYDISNEVFGNMLVALTEAVNNAMLHGNKENEKEIVNVDMEMSDNIIKFYVRDGGLGFDYNNLPDPTSPENIEKTTGRGVFLMKNLSDLVVFSDNGATVEIQFHVQMADPAITLNTQDISFDYPSPAKLMQWIDQVVDLEGGKTQAVNFVLCSDTYLLGMNQKFLDHDTLHNRIHHDCKSFYLLHQEQMH